MIGGPAWIDRDAFDIDARLPDGTHASGDVPLMMRALLRERFALVAHPEIRELPVYGLVRARSDGRLGDQLRIRVGSCNREPDASGHFERCGVRFRPGWFFGNAVTMAAVTAYLSQLVARVVIDRTGLTDRYDFDLRYTPGPAGPVPGALRPIDPYAPSIFPRCRSNSG